MRAETTRFGRRAHLYRRGGDIGRNQLQSCGVATSLHDSEGFATLLVGP